MTWIDFWPLYTFGLLVVFAIPVVLRGMRRKPGGSTHKPNSGGGPGGD